MDRHCIRPRERASAVVVLCAAMLAAVALPAGATPADDAYIRGYAAAVLERSLGITGARVEVVDGVLTVSDGDGLAHERERIVGALSGIRGVVRVEVAGRSEPKAPTTAPPATAASHPADRASPAAAPATPDRRLPTGWLPAGLLFDPLLADPRWPNFSAGYQRYLGDQDFRDVAAASFGETFPFYRHDLGAYGQWEVGLQAGVFSIFDLDSSSFDLINADYFVAVPLSYRRGPFSAIGRVFHQSSHLGDEFLLRSNTQRINLSYEGIDAKLSYDLFGRALRVYGGAGYLFDRDPSTLAPWSTQWGFEVQSPRTLFRGLARPVFAADFQNREENGWDTDISLRAGLQFESVQVLGRKLVWMLEYFNGHSPNGQFLTDKVQYFGVAAHLYY